MGTRSTIHIVDSEGESPVTLARLYLQWDGYPTGVGANIQRILGGKTMVNGYNDAETQINGPGCMGAMLIGGLKDGCGGVYLVDPNDDDRCSYHYEVAAQGPGKPIRLTVHGYGGTVLYKGPINEFDPEKAENHEDGEG
jgi:hypothetical protein